MSNSKKPCTHEGGRANYPCAWRCMNCGQRTDQGEIDKQNEIRDSLARLLAWALDSLVDLDGSSYVPVHNCGYSTSPESGYCDFHEHWGDAAGLLIELHTAGVITAPAWLVRNDLWESDYGTD